MPEYSLDQIVQAASDITDDDLFIVGGNTVIVTKGTIGTVQSLFFEDDKLIDVFFEGQPNSWLIDIALVAPVEVQS